MKRRSTVAVGWGTAAVITATLSSCGLAADERAARAPSDGPYPVTVTNCGAEVTFPAAPQDVVMLKSSAVPFLAALGVLDRVTARAGQYPRAYYDDATWAELAEIPALTDRTDTSGHLQVSPEVVLGAEPDLVLGQVDNLDRSTLEDLGIPLLEEPAMCAEGLAEPGFDDVLSQMELYGQVFDRAGAAAAAIEDLRARLADLRVDADARERPRTAAVLYPTAGGGTTFAYGTRSMAHPLLEAAGFENAFADADERVFEVTTEELLGRDPDALILLHSAGPPGEVVEALLALPGAAELTAVREDELLPLLFNFVEPPTPLSVEGLAIIRDELGTGS